MPYNTEKYSNDAQTTLASGIPNEVATFIRVNSRTPFPGNPRFRIRIEDELLIVESGANTTEWIVTRGAESTNAVSHASGITITHILTQGSIDAIRNNMLSIGNVPVEATGDASTIFLPISGHMLQSWNANKWNYWGPLIGGLEPPALSGFIWYNQSNATGIVIYGGINITSTGMGDDGTGQPMMLLQQAPVTPYRYTAVLLPRMEHANIAGYPTCGLVFRDSGTVNNYSIFGMHRSANSNPLFVWIDYNNAGSVATVMADEIIDVGLGPCLILRIEDDGVNHSLYHSVDGISFILDARRLRTAFCVPRQIGLAVNNDRGICGMAAIHWKVEQL